MGFGFTQQHSIALELTHVRKVPPAGNSTVIQSGQADREALPGGLAPLRVNVGIGRLHECATLEFAVDNQLESR